MSFESARQAVLTYVIAQAAAAGITAPLVFENLNKIDHSVDIGAFVTVKFHYRESDQADLEARTTRYDGEAIFEIHVPEGKGTKVANDLADLITPFMRYKLVSGIQFQAPRLGQPIPYKAYSISRLAFSFHYTE